MKKSIFWLLVAACVGVAGYALYAYFVVEPGSTVHPVMRRTFEAHRFAILTHVFASVVALLVGPWQFLPAVRRHPLVHRRLGYAYFSAVFVGGGSGLYMATIAYGGFVARLGFGLLAVTWLLTAAMALGAVKRKDYAAHERWAIRCFGLTFAAVTLRIYLGTFFAAGMNFDDFYPAVAWLCWVPNVLFVEWVILRRPVGAAQPPENLVGV